MNILNTVKDTCSMLSMSRTTFYAIVKAGEIRAVKLGNRTLVHKDEIERFIGSLARLE
ncbi:MAG: helix-turn-helix domain-containing protein [Alphaproteobacteria bacterium PA4]|nr:MAG: helix-turn-helix domain-containing protein [Alphaproteobacteria bacterium PA4]